MTRPWAAKALCAQPIIDAAAFYAEEATNLRPRDAQKVCQQCPVVAECLAYALEHEDYGVWGGTTENERRKMRTRRRLDALAAR